MALRNIVLFKPFCYSFSPVLGGICKYFGCRQKCVMRFIFPLINIKSKNTLNWSSTHNPLPSYFQYFMFNCSFKMFSHVRNTCRKCSRVKRDEKSIYYTLISLSLTRCLATYVQQHDREMVNVHCGTNVRFCDCQCQWFVLHHVSTPYTCWWSIVMEEMGINVGTNCH